MQPIAAREVGEQLVAHAADAAQSRARDLAGPREEKLDEMVRAFARRAGHRGWIPSISVPGAQMKGMRAGLALPEPGARLGQETFAHWLARPEG